EDTAFKETLVEITSKRLGVTGVLGAAGELCGVITDGDLRRALERTDDPRGLRARDLMTASPKTIAGTALAAEAVAIMERLAITSLFILADGSRRLALEHLGIAFPDLDAGGRRRLARSTFRHAGESFAELALWPRLAERPEYVVVEGAATLDAALGAGKGCIAVAGHVGNWEV